MKNTKHPVHPTLASNFQLLVNNSPYKTVYALDTAVVEAKRKTDDGRDTLSEEEKLLVALPSGRTLYSLQNGAQTPNKNTLNALVAYYNYLHPHLTTTSEEFLKIDLANYYNRFCTCSKREAFSGLYGCYYLTVYDNHTVGGLLYLDFENIKELRAVLVTEISSDDVLQDPELQTLIQSYDKDGSTALKEAFLAYKGTSFSKERLQLMISSSIEITNKSLSIVFEHVDDPKKQLSIGLNIARFIEHRTIYHGGTAIAFSNNNTIHGLAAFRMVLASLENLYPISLKNKELYNQLRHRDADVLYISDPLDTLGYRFLGEFKRESGLNDVN